MKNLFKKFGPAVILTIVLIFIFVQPAKAAIFDIAGNTIGTIINYFAYIIGIATSYVFVLCSHLANIFLKLNFKILDETNQLVYTGWGAAREIANLGFVLVIILIALATVLRYKEYGTQKLLFRLIAAAILVNFSLTIAGVLIDFSHVLTNFFLSKLIGGDIASGLAGAFNPQGLFSQTTLVENAGGGEVLLASILNLFFIIIFNLIGAFSMLALAIMFFLRFLHLSFLLIISPIVWLFWVMPSLSGKFKEWWHAFTKWVFFAPASSFFIYLAIISAKRLSNQPEIFSSQILNGLMDSVTNILSKGAQMIVLAGILLGGLIIAQKMSIDGASGAVGLAGKAGKWAKGKAGQFGSRLGTAPLRSSLGQKITTNLQKGDKGFYKVAATYLGGRQIGNLLSQGGVIQSERMVKQAEEKQKKFSDKQLALRVAVMNKDERVAALTRLAKNKNLDMVLNVSSHIKDPTTKKIFENHGKGKEYGDLEKTFGANTEMLNAETPETKKAAAEKFIKTYSIKDYDKLQSNLFSKFDEKKNNLGLSETEHEEMKKMMIQSIMDTQPGAISKIRTKLKAPDLMQFQDNLDVYVKKFERDIEMPAEKKSIKDKLEYIDNSKDYSNLSNKARGIYGVYKNFGGSLLGHTSFPETPETQEESTLTQ